MYPACKIYYGVCEHCRDNYIGKTVRNTVTRCSEHNNSNHKSEPAEHIKINIDHVFKWKVLSQLPHRNISGRTFIALYKPSLNDQKSFDRLMLSRNGIT